MKFNLYELYKLEEGIDKYGNPSNEWVKVDDVEVCISIKTISQVSNETLYKVENIIGITKYSNIYNNSEYKLVENTNVYNIKTIIHGRFNQLDLVKVIK